MRNGIPFARVGLILVHIFLEKSEPRHNGK
jgi:hypothetical protein